MLVVDDGSTDGTPSLLAGARRAIACAWCATRRNRGIAAAYDTIVQEARGELIARLGHDDIALPDRIARQVAVFDRHPETGVVHGDAVTIDGAGRTIGSWRSGDYPRRVLIDLLVRRLNNIVDPSSMLHRRVHDAVGGYDGAFPMCNDFDYWLRAARTFRFRHVAGGPLILYRRHGANFSDESHRAQELNEVEAALRKNLADWPLDDLVPELDWAVLPRPWAERRACLVLAEAFDRPRPARARVGVASPRRPGSRARRGAPVASASGQRIVLSSFGFADAGGGTIVPRYVAKELAQRGHEVTVFAAGVGAARGRAGLRAAERRRGRRRGRVGAQPAARAARPRPSPSRARRSSRSGRHSRRCSIG